jgi:hypothetical protein
MIITSSKPQKQDGENSARNQNNILSMTTDHLINGYKRSVQNTCSFILSWKVEGSILGNSFRKTGNRNSIKGTIMNTATGTSLNMSAVVRVSCCLSLLDRLLPLASFKRSLEEILTSAHSSFKPSQ